MRWRTERILLGLTTDRCEIRLRCKMNPTEKLIEHVKTHKILYDLSHPEYKNIKKKNKVWDEIGILLCTNGEDLKKKWKNLRDSYAKHVRAEVVTHTGQERKTIDRYKTWLWAKQMEIFKPFLQFARTSSNISAVKNDNISANNDEQFEKSDTEDAATVSQNETFADEESQQLTPSTAHNTTTNVSIMPVEDTPRSNSTSRKRRLEQTTTPSSVDKVIAYLQNTTGGNTQTEYDEIDLIFFSYAKTVKKMSRSRQAVTKFRIAQVLMEEELNEQLEDVSNTSVVSIPSTSECSIPPGSIRSPISEVSNAPLCSDSDHTTTTSWYEQFSQTQL